MSTRTYCFKYTIGQAPPFIRRNQQDGTPVWLRVNVKSDCEENARREAITKLNKIKIYPRQLQLVTATTDDEDTAGAA